MKIKALETINDSLNLLTFSKLFVLVDENTKRFCLPKLLSDLSNPQEVIILEIASGESNKTIHSCLEIWKKLSHYQADRKSILINLGGGVISDLGGFVASSFKRGIRFINIPSTLIGMVDAAFGGKTAVNLHAAKNQIGNFSKPEMVLIEKSFLESLPEEHLLSGFGEMLKYGLILDNDLWKQLGSLNRRELDQIDSAHIHRCIELKMSIVEQDYRENGLRKILNFGHTIGHALESLFLEKEKTLHHGEAVAHGMIIESIIASHKGLLKNNELEEISQVILSFFPKLTIDTNHLLPLLNFMRQDKKNENEVVNFTLLHSIGKAHIDYFIEKDEIFNAIDDYIHL
jgi:3-dehydroquinate synthase